MRSQSCWISEIYCMIICRGQPQAMETSFCSHILRILSVMCVSHATKQFNCSADKFMPQDLWRLLCQLTSCIIVRVWLYSNLVYISWYDNFSTWYCTTKCKYENSIYEESKNTNFDVKINIMFNIDILGMGSQHLLEEHHWKTWSIDRVYYRTPLKVMVDR